MVWKVRCLLNKIISRFKRPLQEPGKGDYWTLEFSDGLGNKRIQKRRQKTSEKTTVESARAEAQTSAGPDRERSSNVTNHPEQCDPVQLAQSIPTATTRIEVNTSEAIDAVDHPGQLRGGTREEDAIALPDPHASLREPTLIANPSGVKSASPPRSKNGCDIFILNHARNMQSDGRCSDDAVYHMRPIAAPRGTVIGSTVTDSAAYEEVGE